MNHRVVLLLAPVLVVGCFAETSPSETETDEKLFGFGEAEQLPRCSIDLGGRLASIGSPGVGVGIVNSGDVQCSAHAGLADVENNVAVQNDTLFLWASITKTVIAATAMTLVEAGQLDLEADINTYLPFAVRNPNSSCVDRPISVRQLMTHTSSLIDNDDVYDDSYSWGTDSPVELMSFLESYYVPGNEHYDQSRNFLRSCPGTSYQYSNIAVGLLGAIIQKVVNDNTWSLWEISLNDIVQERIFSPLGVSGASLHLAGLDQSKISVTYARNEDTGKLEPLPHPTWITFPDGGLRASVADLGKFLAMIANGGTYRGTRVLSAGSVESMLSNNQAPNVRSNQGLIWFYEGNLVGHDGSDDGAAALMFFDRSDGVGALVAANSDFGESSTTNSAALALLRDLIAEGRRE